MRRLYREDENLEAVFESVDSAEREERLAQQVVVEQGVTPARSLYDALRPASRNLGEVDLEAFTRGGRKKS
jgi:hypothetical protein